MNCQCTAELSNSALSIQGADMTKSQAAKLQTKWKQRGDQATPCQHQTQELAPTDEGYVTTTYYCLECGEVIERPYERYAT